MTVAVPPPDPACTLAERFAVHAGAHDRSSAFPHANLAALHEAGLLALTVPRRLGGGCAGLARAAEVVGRIGTGDPATARCVVPGCDGALSTLTREAEDALWQEFFTAAPERRRVFEPSSKRRKKVAAPWPRSTA